VKILGVPLVELEVEQFPLPITGYTTSYFLTARLAVRRRPPRKHSLEICPQSSCLTAFA
jgi:hypothetical protein